MGRTVSAWNMFRCSKLGRFFSSAHSRLFANEDRKVEYYPYRPMSFSKKPVRILEPASETQRVNQQVSKPKDSSSRFNLIMGEIILGIRSKKFAVEGVRLIEDALQAGLKLEKVFLQNDLTKISHKLNYLLEHEKEQNSLNQSNAEPKLPEILRVGKKLMKTWSSVTTPPGIIGIFLKPLKTEMMIPAESNYWELPVTVLCDNIREPGNLGSIIRSAAGAGCRKIILPKGCADPWNMKVIRGGAGAHFRIPIEAQVEPESLANLLKSTVDSYDCIDASSNASKACLVLCDNKDMDARLELPSHNYSDLSYSKYSQLFLVLGGETHGLTLNTVKLARSLQLESNIDVVRVKVPLCRDLESLNSANAFGIILFEILRQLRK